MAEQDGKPRERVSAYAFFVKSYRKAHKKKHPNRNVVFAEFAKNCAEQWKNLSDKEKRLFHDKAEKDKKRYEQEMVNYKLSQSNSAVVGKQSAKPRGRMSAYAFFVQSCREEHQQAHPNENLVFAEFSKDCCTKWKNMSDTEKQQFHDKAETDKKRFEQEMKDYKPPKVKSTLAPFLNMSDEEKKPFNDMSENDKQRYEQEMANY